MVDPQKWNLTVLSLLSCDELTMIAIYHPSNVSAERFTNQNALNLYVVFNFKGSTQICRHFAHLICIIIIQHVTFMVKLFLHI